jgi:uncharacterized protein YceK
MKRSLLMLALLCALSGCGSLIQAVNAYGTVAVADARAANDTVIAGWTIAACATPVSAALRNPQIIEALKVLCMPMTDVPASRLFDNILDRQIAADRAAAALQAARNDAATK